MGDWQRRFKEKLEVSLTYKINGNWRISIEFCKGEQSETCVQCFGEEGERRGDMERKRDRPNERRPRGMEGWEPLDGLLEDRARKGIRAIVLWLRLETRGLNCSYFWIRNFWFLVQVFSSAGRTTYYKLLPQQKKKYTLTNVGRRVEEQWIKNYYYFVYLYYHFISAQFPCRLQPSSA